MQLFQIEEKQIAEIIIKDRARNEVGDITSLANSIKMVGQLTPILIDENNVLIDGLHRLKAAESLGMTSIEVRVVSGITQDDHVLIEMLSNMDRKEFAWHEEIELKYKLHNYWKDAAEKENQTWGYRETAKRLHCSLGGLSTDLAFAEALKVFPELKKQSTKGRARELYKAFGDQAVAIQRMDNFTEDEKDRLNALQAGIMPEVKKVKINKDAKIIDGIKKAADISDEPVKVFKADPELFTEEEKETVQNIQVIYVAENYKSFLDKIPDNSVGLVELDPPYAIDFNENYGKANGIESKATDWTEKELFEFYFNYLPLIYNKMLDASWVLCWTGKEHFIEINKIAESIGFQVQQPGSWIKAGGSTNQPKKCLISNWEMYLLFRKGNAQFNTPSLPSAVQIDASNSAQRIHQWEKPIKLYDHFFKALAKPGTIFLTPFAGSGNCLISAAKTRMMPIGCDKSQKYIPQFYQRLEQYTGISADITGL
jgi:ParB family chromosome partitioning protein